MAGGPERRGTLQDYCPGCREHKDPSEWLGTELEYDPSKTPVCNSCRQNGFPPIDPYPMLEPRDRRLLMTLMDTGSIEETQRRHNIPRSTLQSLVYGRSRPVFRRAFQMLMEKEGIDGPAMARKLAALLESTRPSWNNETKEFELYPDNSAQLGAVKQIVKLFDLEPPKEKADGQSGKALQVHIHTNLEEKDVSRKSRPGEMVIDVEAE